MGLFAGFIVASCELQLVDLRGTYIEMLARKWSRWWCSSITGATPVQGRSCVTANTANISTLNVFRIKEYGVRREGPDLLQSFLFSWAGNGEI